MLRSVTSPSVISSLFAHSYCTFTTSSFVHSNSSSQSLRSVFPNLLIPSITFATLSSSFQDGSFPYIILYPAYPIAPHLSVWCNLSYPSELVSAPCSAASLAVAHSFSRKRWNSVKNSRKWWICLFWNVSMGQTKQNHSQYHLQSLRNAPVTCPVFVRHLQTHFLHFVAVIATTKASGKFKFFLNLHNVYLPHLLPVK